jgi:multidrug efflux pump subunit AcrA (membrane-fusion protein)
VNEIVSLDKRSKPAAEPFPAPTLPDRPRKPRRWTARLLGLGALLALIGGIAFGAWRYEVQHHEAVATAERRANFVPEVRVGTVKASDATMVISLPGSTSAFTEANIFARASGYIDKRNVDIGDHVKQGQLLAQITAPELDHQIQQAEANLSQTQATLRQNQANADLANVTWQRDKPLVEKGWVTPQQGDSDRLGLQAQQATIGVAQSNIAAQQAQISVLHQQKDYQSVVAPFDGVNTQRNIDLGSLCLL